jgi:hypothetical protein
MAEDNPTEKCYLCGKELTNTNSTKDHLFPECLFPKPLPSNLPKRLPAHENCNNELSKDEELFRVFVASGMAYESQAGFRIWTERIRTDLKGRRPRLKPLIQSLTKVAQVVSESGEPLGHTLVLETNPEPINRVLRKIAKGLYYLDTGQILPSEVQILVGYDNGQPERFVAPPLDEAIKGARRVDLGDGVVTYWRNTIRGDPAYSLTWLEFYKDKVFLVCTYR